MNRSLALSLVSLAFLLPAAKAQAQDADAVAATYEVIIGGLEALKINYDATVSPLGYRSRAVVDTQGIAGWLSDYHMNMAASGTIAGGKPAPQQFSSVSEKDSKHKRIAVSWSQGLARTDRPIDKDEGLVAEVEAALTAEIADPLTAVLRLGAGDRGKPCQTAERVFSGRDVYELRFSLEGEAKIGSGSQGVYRGGAYRCRMVYLPVAGRAARKFRKKGGEAPVFEVWFAPVRSEALGRELLVPVLASGKLNGLDFSAYASRATIAGQPLNQLSRAGD